MPNNYIAVSLSGSSTLGGTLYSCVNRYCSAHGTLAQLKADMDNMTDGVTFATLEAAFGIPTGKGQTVYNLVAGALADLNASSNFTNLQAWLGATR
jgi:hypothetical protein